ncbi:uncharacterized protein LOC126797979 isoform X2 [Argentina anserina]|uniref:uncharacterized protein LOC126797979 isoform X2 n=1 Tax=Argentina anserina TaxID=57926 RepID=UPI00217664F4|nr:uncharacterized protein LOC126797979 isoform X2 [Potentilla anserina]
MSASSWHTLTGLAALSSSSSSSTSKRRRLIPHSLSLTRSSLTGLREISAEPKQPQPDALAFTQALRNQNDAVRKKNRGGGDDDDDDQEEDQAISNIPVPRQKYIPVSKAELLDGVVSKLFADDEDDVLEQFLLLSSCLDSILHAEHKSILEEMRADYSDSNSVEYKQAVEEVSEEAMAEGTNGNGRVDGYGSGDNEAENSIPFDYVEGLRKLLRSSVKDVKRVSVATRFQRSFMQLLYNAQFEELSAKDLMLTSALNSDYLLTLPIYVDWKKASESNAIIYRRGYATERQNGLLLVEKLEYIQSKLLRGIFFIVSKPLGEIGSWITESLKVAFQTPEVQDWTEKVKLWLKELSVFQQGFRTNEQTSDDLLGVDQLPDMELPIWLAAQRAVSRYEGILSAVGPRGRLLRKLLSWIGLISLVPETPFELDGDAYASDPYARPIFLSRISLSDIWRPASWKYCEKNIWKMLKTSVSILFSKSILQEAAYQELILLYTKEGDDRNNEDSASVPSLQLKIYEKIPIPDLPVIFPHKKLSFRIIDTVRLDIASTLALSAYFINYKFVNVLSSPSAIYLDVVAITALVIYISRVVLGYKQTWDRYQLLVNKTLYEKTLASGFGSVHFLLDASEQQQYKEAILAYAILLRAERGKLTSCKSVGDKCERFMYDVFKVKVEMPIDKAIATLIRLGLAAETSTDGRTTLQAISCSSAYYSLKQRWNSLLDQD